MSTVPSTTTPTASRTNSKSSKASKRIILRLPSHLLAKFPSAQPVRKASRSKPPVIAPVADNAPQTPDTTAGEVKAESAATPVPDVNDTKSEDLSSNTSKPKGTSAARTSGVKRSAAALDGDAGKGQKARPGPKKRAKTDADSHTPVAANTILPHHKLGPKANQGAINAGLRALDRTGKPSRKWVKKGFQIKSFTGVVWQAPSWEAGGARGFAGDVKSDTTGSSDNAKPEQASSLPSDKSNSGADAAGSAMVLDVASSPAPLAVETPQPV